MKILISFSLVASLTLAGCTNIFEAASNKTSDAALYEDAQKAIDDQDYTTALEKFEAMSADYQSQKDVIEAWAGAYAGKCGLDFISYFTSLGSADLSSSTIFSFFMSAWSQKVIDPASCTSAQTKMEELGASAADRTNSQNLFMAILGMVKVGIYLRSYADTDGTDNLGDGTPDASVNACTDDSANLPQAALDEVITGLGLITDNISYLTAVMASSGITDALDDLNTACSASPGACGKTDPTTISTADRDLFRDLLATGATNPVAPMGIGSCVNPLVTACCP